MPDLTWLAAPPPATKSTCDNCRDVASASVPPIVASIVPRDKWAIAAGERAKSEGSLAGEGGGHQPQTRPSRPRDRAKSLHGLICGPLIPRPILTHDGKVQHRSNITATKIHVSSTWQRHRTIRCVWRLGCGLSGSEPLIFIRLLRPTELEQSAKTF